MQWLLGCSRRDRPAGGNSSAYPGVKPESRALIRGRQDIVALARIVEPRPGLGCQTRPEGAGRKMSHYVTGRCGSEVCWRAWIEHMFAALDSPARPVS